LSRDRKDVAAIKHGKKPTREQRKLMTKWKLSSEDWLVVKDEPTQMTLVHRHFDNRTKTIPKGVREDG
jgi:hypothetical protein